ncbi:Crp/Fnr family transcriptional regulator [Nitrincola sp. MINF-07-Sa-05]|uniref:Crp/Fnr family transcriptional regulator n=1 Tax=Nitrincola salilacus TaxID=3400273 RepID=UPI003917BD9E
MLNELERLFRALNPMEKSFDMGETVFRRNQSVSSLYFVLSGHASLIRHREDGVELVLQRAGIGKVLAEASLFSDRYHCDARAGESTVLLQVNRSRLIDLLQSDPALSMLWLESLSHSVQQARTRAEIISLRTVRERLDAWLLMNGESLPEKGQWKRMAAELAVSPEALYRELAARKNS